MIKKLMIQSTLIATIIVMDILVGVEFDLFVPSFPEIQQHYALSAFWVEALLSSNFAGFCLSLFFVGGLADRHGRKPIIICGLLIFILGSLFCLWAEHYPWLLIGRFLQGIGVAAPSILSFLIIADTYPLKQQQTLMAILNGVMNFSVGAAPVVGSYIAYHYKVRGNFLALLTLSIVTLFMTILFVRTPDKVTLMQKKEVTFGGYMPIFSSKPLLLLMGHIVVQIVPYWIFVGMSALLYIQDLGVSLDHFGYYQGSLAFLFAIGSFMSGFLIKRYDHKRLLYSSVYIFTIGLLCLAVVSFFPIQSPLLITLAFVPFVLGQVIPTTLLYTLSFNYLPQAKGKIAAMLQVGRLVFSAISLQLAGYFYTGTFKNVGIIMMGFIMLTILTLLKVLKNESLMTALYKR